MRKILMMAVLAFLSLQGVGARASGISLLESGKKKPICVEYSQVLSLRLSLY